MFRISHLKWQRYWQQRFFDRQLAQLKKDKAPNDKFLELNHNEYVSMADIENAIDYVVSRRLLDNARSLDVEIPATDDRTMWSRSGDGENVWLTSRGRSLVRKAIDEEKDRKFKVKTRWIVSVVLPVASIIIAIIGAITGLIAVHQRQEKRPPNSRPLLRLLHVQPVSASSTGNNAAESLEYLYDPTEKRG